MEAGGNRMITIHKEVGTVSTTKEGAERDRILLNLNEIVLTELIKKLEVRIKK